MTSPRNPEGWFVSLKDAKSGKISELMIARTPEAAEEWRAKGYIVRPFIYIAEPEGELRVCENCKHGRFRSIDDFGVCHLIDGNFSDVKLPLVRQIDDNFTFTVPKDFHCKLWESKDVGQTKAP